MNIGKPQLEKWFTPWALAQIQDQIGPLGIRMEIEPRHYLRSLDQNKKFHAMCRELGDHVGMTLNEVKQEALIEFHGEKFVTLGKQERRVPRGKSSNLSTVDFSALIGIVDRWSALAGVPVEAE